MFHSSIRMLAGAVLLIAFGTGSESARANTMPCGITAAPPTINKADGVSEKFSRFLGAWPNGGWDFDTSTLCAAVYVKTVRPDGSVDIVYIHGESAQYGYRRRLDHTEGKIEGDTLTFRTTDGRLHSFTYFSGVSPYLEGHFFSGSGKKRTGKFWR